MKSRPGVVLIAEDHPINRQVVQLYLSELGIDCCLVNNGLEAVQAIEKNDYSVVLMDCHMPEMDGFQAAIKIRKNEKLTGRHIPIIAMTAGALKGDRERCLLAGMDEYLCKPVDIEQLKNTLLKWMPGQAPSEQNEQAALPSAELKVAINTTFDVQDLTARFGKSNLRSLLSMFCDQTPSTFQELQQAVEACDKDTLAHAAHALQGVFCIVGNQNISQICQILEQHARENRLDLATVTLIDFEKQFELLLRDVTSELKLITP